MKQRNPKKARKRYRGANYASSLTCYVCQPKNQKDSNDTNDSHFVAHGTSLSENNVILTFVVSMNK